MVFHRTSRQTTCCWVPRDDGERLVVRGQKNVISTPGESDDGWRMNLYLRRQHIHSITYGPTQHIVCEFPGFPDLKFVTVGGILYESTCSLHSRDYSSCSCWLIFFMSPHLSITAVLERREVGLSGENTVVVRYFLGYPPNTNRFVCYTIVHLEYIYMYNIYIWVGW